MASSYPGSLDSLTNPTAGSLMTSPSHAGQHTDANDCIEAIEGALGTNPQGGAATVAARLATIEASLGGSMVAKPSDTVRTNDATEDPDPHLTLPVGVGRYYFKAMLRYAMASDNPGCKAALYPGGAAVVSNAAGYQDSDLETSGLGTDILSISTSGAGTSGDHVVVWEGVIEFSTGGSLDIVWSQNSSHADATTMRRGSFLLVRQL